MRTLNNREKRTVFAGGIVVAICVLLFLYRTVWPPLQAWQAQYRQLVKDAAILKTQSSLYADKAAAAKKLMETYRLDPATLSRTSIVANASAAIQRAAAGERIQIAHMSESTSRGTAKQLATIQLELSGPVQGIMSLLHRLDSLGYPLVIESLQIDAAAAGGQPGMPPGMSINMGGGMPPGMRGAMPGGVTVEMLGGMAGGMPPGLRGGGAGGLPGAPGSIKLKLTIAILDYEQWKLEGKRNV